MASSLPLELFKNATATVQGEPSARETATEGGEFATFEARAETHEDPGNDSSGSCILLK